MLLRLVQINFLLLVFLHSGFSQESQSFYASTITEKVYTDLRIALQSKELVHRLNLSRQELKSFPQEIFQFENLQYLVLNENEIEQIPLRSNQLNNLVYLSIKNNKIREIEIPDNCLTQLKELHLDFNQLLEFPELNNELMELTTLSLNYNYITQLPPNQISLSRLQHFNMDANPLRNAEQAFTYSTQLERLSLFRTKLDSIPKNLVFGRILKLVLGDNPIDLKQITASSFPKLEYLDASHCNLYSNTALIPICKLKSLKYLILDDCRIQNLPSEIINLKKLREISLIKNDLKVLPPEFYQLKLKLINLEKNPLNQEQKDLIRKKLPKATIHF
ncbi:MAG: hypothetical protein CL840_19355 [Crocinitomicaceae bacterium]|nr:hypothetical protein [Crocinitomicaceae bacterium]|tara:strand:+ start:10755 stop:11753 length:999 start_codon:yes stop_codon:yes gene_type:complete